MFMSSEVLAAEWFTKFSKEDWIWSTADTVVTTMDWGQTLDIVDRGDTYHETNFYLGDHPSRGKVNTYFFIANAFQWGVSWALPTDAELLGFRFNPRRAFQVTWATVETTTVAHNYAIGLRFSF